jgi:hypothetical protein
MDGTQSSSGRQRWSTTSARGAMCSTMAWGLRRLWCSLFSVGSRGLVSLRGLTTDRGTLSRVVQINILRHPAQRFTNHKNNQE